MTLEQILATAPTKRSAKPVRTPAQILASMHSAIDAAAESIRAAGPHGQVVLYWHEHGVDAYVLQRTGKHTIRHTESPQRRLVNHRTRLRCRES